MRRILVVVLLSLGCAPGAMATGGSTTARDTRADDQAAVRPVQPTEGNTAAEPRAVSPPVTSTSAAAPGGDASAPWWCLLFSHDAVGLCKQSQRECEAARAYAQAGQANPREEISPCKPAQQAICLATKGRQGGDTDVRCHPTFSSCRTSTDYRKNEQASVVMPCRAFPPTAPRSAETDALAADEAAHWWCVTLANGTIGSCDRTRARCEDSRGFAIRDTLRHGHSRTEVSDCVSQPSAICFDTQDVTGDARHLECFPTGPLCDSTVEAFNRRGNVRVISDCRSVE
jgi:hypothetical protein